MQLINLFVDQSLQCSICVMTRTITLKELVNLKNKIKIVFKVQTTKSVSISPSCLEYEVVLYNHIFMVVLNPFFSQNNLN
jgi:hypothetical protein